VGVLVGTPNIFTQLAAQNAQGNNSPSASAPSAPSTSTPAMVSTGTDGTNGPTPDTHVFNATAWASHHANQGKDVNGAIAEAKRQGYKVVNDPTASNIFTQLAAQNTPGATPQQSARPMDTDIHDFSLGGQVKQLNAIGAGAGEGLLDTLSGVSHATRWLDPTGNIADASSQLLGDKSKELEQENAGNPILNKIGYAGETLAEFVMGDEALKGLSMADKLLQTAKTMKIFENSPKLIQALKIGAAALNTGAKAGTVQGSLSLARTGGDVGEAAKEAAITGAAGGVLGGIVGAVPAVRGIFSADSIQPSLQQGMRDVLNTVAKEAGVTPSPAASIRDVAGQVADAIEAKSKGIYQQLDQATGGRFQRYDDALRNINQKLRETSGLDDENESALLKRKTDVEASQHAAFEDAKAAGVDPKLVDQARLTYKQAQALFDLDTQLKMSTSGMRPELASPGSSSELVDPKKAFARLNKLYDSGRLQQAVGQQQAEQLVQHADAAFLHAQKIAGRVQALKTAGKITGTGAAVGALGEGAKVVKDAFGSQ
jgi:hypothetical protein